MGNIIVMDETTKNPITLIGVVSGVCYGSNTEDSMKNFRRGLKNLASGHGRTFEYPQVYLTIDGYSARVIRELYTHIGGAPSRLQASTRYINYDNFEYIVPPSIGNNWEMASAYESVMASIRDGFDLLERLGAPKEDIANILPLGMTTRIVMRTNMRNLIDMSHQRLCTRAYWEFRQLMMDIMHELSSYSEEWDYIVKNFMVPKCMVEGACHEHDSCGKMPKA